ncbi:MAG: hypothetical protein J3K34DRAFT_437250 [Monoraphidium minutum]|nr:MAG: hypothetical protein J3K34DRAFT_437250 [Monoraphidium minutum]
MAGQILVNSSLQWQQHVLETAARPQKVRPRRAPGRCRGGHAPSRRRRARAAGLGAGGRDVSTGCSAKGSSFSRRPDHWGAPHAGRLDAPSVAWAFTKGRAPRAAERRGVDKKQARPRAARAAKRGGGGARRGAARRGVDGAVAPGAGDVQVL